MRYQKHRKDVDMDLRAKVGVWVLWNIIGDSPTYEESKELAPAIGTYLLGVVGDFRK
jgi:hypothetical protein